MDHRKTVMERFEQHMPADMKWNKFLRNTKNLHYNIKHDCFFKCNTEKYTKILKICDYLSKGICESIIAFHAITSSDTNSYFFRESKVKTSKKTSVKSHKAEIN